MKLNPIMGVLFAAILLITFFPAVLLAESTESKETPWERFSLSLGGFITTLDSTVVLGAKELGTGLEFNAEDALGLDSGLTVFRGGPLCAPGRQQTPPAGFQLL